MKNILQFSVPGITVAKNFDEEHQEFATYVTQNDEASIILIAERFDSFFMLTSELTKAALFSSLPIEDIYIRCKNAILSFGKNEVLRACMYHTLIYARHLCVSSCSMEDERVFSYLISLLSGIRNVSGDEAYWEPESFLSSITGMLRWCSVGDEESYMKLYNGDYVYGVLTDKAEEDKESKGKGEDISQNTSHNARSDSGIRRKKDGGKGGISKPRKSLKRPTAE